ncbi:MAG: excinuclease ABC subunit UvrC [Candidatus Omnitrophota bacterium]
MDIKKKINKLPASCGVYLFKDASGTVLYVGKAAKLRSRVGSYFRTSADLSPGKELLVRRVVDIDFIQTATSAEALLYENSLIKQYQPKYNVALRDDKTYPMLKVTAGEAFPRLLITRKKKNDGAVYYGPFTDAGLLKEALKILRKLFPLRTCAAMTRSVCLDYHIQQCRGPCEKKIGETEYNDIAAELRLFLEGKRDELVKLLSKKMVVSSRREDFEEAARLRDTIATVRAIGERRGAFNAESALRELGGILAVRDPLDEIEALDISNIMGQQACGSVVRFSAGKPKKNEYKRFKIRNVSGIDDYKMMKEVVLRRYGRLLEEKRRLPDLIIIDGGKGHLAAAIEALGSLGISETPVIGIAKAFESVYLAGRRSPIMLPKDSRALHLLQRIRDEAHRFAIAYHKKMRKSLIRRSRLDEIIGIGPAKKKNLLVRFGSVEKIRRAGKKDLLTVEGIHEKIAERIIRHFNT